jgi:hypothetical protein
MTPPEGARQRWPNLPPGTAPSAVPILSLDAMHEIIGQIVQHALIDDCGHSIMQADCFACGMNHALRGLLAPLRGVAD